MTHSSEIRARNNEYDELFLSFMMHCGLFTSFSLFIIAAVLRDPTLVRCPLRHQIRNSAHPFDSLSGRLWFIFTNNVNVHLVYKGYHTFSSNH